LQNTDANKRSLLTKDSNHPREQRKLDFKNRSREPQLQPPAQLRNGVELVADIVETPSNKLLFMFGFSEGGSIGL
jgi:hypothetical protein